jgi:peptide/nickel transport system permease protein
MLSRLLWGARSSLVMTFATLAIAATVGLFLGAVAGYLGRFTETITMRTVDVFFGLPPVLFAILVAMSLGPGLATMIAAMTIVFIPPMVRLAYQSVVSMRDQSFVDAARVAGASRLRIIWDQILPNIFSPVVAYAASLAGTVIVFGAGLSFVGLGIQPPDADWGRMINEGRNVLFVAPHVATLPGLAVFIVAVAFNAITEASRDALDPRLRR